MKRHWQYLKYLARHKYFVFRAGLWTGAPLWRLIIHDWSKFLPSEWLPYSRKFYGPTPERVAALEGARWRAISERSRGPLSEIAERGHYQAVRELARSLEKSINDDFNRAWLKHQHRNPHHWQHWLLTLDQPGAPGDWSIMSPDGNGRYLDLAERVDTGTTGGREWERWDLSSEIGLLPESSSTAADRARRDRRYRMLSRLVTRANRVNPLPMPDHFVREMVADWAGAGRAITGRWELSEWWAKNAGNMVLHPTTRARVQELVNHLSAEGHIPWFGIGMGAVSG